MDEIVVAETDGSMVVTAAVGVTIILGIELIFVEGIVRWLLLALGIGFVYRLTQMKVSVTSSSVVVVNLFVRYELPLAGTRIVTEKDRSPYLSDGGGKMDNTGRVLYLVSDTGEKVRVGVAPMFGNRLDVIAEDLDRAIATMQASDV